MKPDFEISFNKSLSNEGLISNNPNDKGGFTYKGISRKRHPAWPGWQIIDSVIPSLSSERRATGACPPLGVGEVAEQLNQLVMEFYRTEFWEKIKGDFLPNQLIADEIFDTSINLGVPAASEIVQRVINLLNRNSHLYPDIVVDGAIGQETLLSLYRCINTNGLKLVYNLLNFYQAKRYIEIMERDSTQEIFIGWFSRVDMKLM